MSRPLKAVETEAALVAKRRESFDRLANGRLTADEERLERERHAAIGEELAALRAKAAPPPPPPVVKDIGSVSPAEARARAAALRALPEFFTGRKADGTRLTPAEHERLAREASELAGRAAEEA